MFQRSALFVINIFGLSLVTSCLPAPSANNGSGTQKPAAATDRKQPASNMLSDIGAESMFVLQSGQNTSIAQVAARSQTPYTLFQFVGVTCEACKKEAPYVTNIIGKYSGSVSRVLIFPNQASEYQPSEYAGFSSKFSASAPYVIDDSLAVIKKIRAKTTQYFGVFIVVGRDGKGLVLNSDEAYLSVDSALQSIVKK
jgi:hypothetical protein